MIALPTSPAPRSVAPRYLDKGLIMQPATGAGAQHFDRPGSRFGADFALPPMAPATARVFVSRLLAAKTEGLRIPYPLVGAPQGNPGAPLVKTATTGGTSLPLKGLNPGYDVGEGYWLTVIDAAGVHYLHNVRVGGTADGSGEVTLTVRPPLRTALAVNAVVLLQRPLIEGLVTSAFEWAIPGSRLIELGFTVEEQA